MAGKREFETIRTEWPALIRFDGKYFEEEYDIDVDETKFREVGDEYVERMRRSGMERSQTPASPQD